MTKVYRPVGAVIQARIDELRAKHYPELDGVNIGALFVFDDEDDLPVLKHQGYAAAALVRIVGLRDRAQGMPDAQIIIDKMTFEERDSRKQLAILDHELYHLLPKIDKHGVRQFDALDRPKLTMRKHDWQLGWFDEIANRHGANSIEVMQARKLVSMSGQMYFDFGGGKEADAA